MLLHYDAEYVCVEFTVYNKNYGIISVLFPLLIDSFHIIFTNNNKKKASLLFFFFIKLAN